MDHKGHVNLMVGEPKQMHMDTYLNIRWICSLLFSYDLILMLGFYGQPGSFAVQVN